MISFAFVFLLGARLAFAEAAKVSVMTFNAENLFDAEHDAGKDDLTFLPLAKKNSSRHRAACAEMKREAYREQCLHWDWSKETAALKRQRVAAAILQVNDGLGPDLLFLQEVENRAVLETLLSGPLAPAGYRAPIHIETSDPRGIDQAILSRLEPVGSPELVSAPKGSGRGFLRQAFRLPGGGTLTAVSVHLPSPGAPRAARERAISAIGNLKSSGPMIVGGDFNVTSEEDAEFSIWDRASARWLVSHRLGCRKCPGTNFFRPKSSWSFLDVLLMSKDLSPYGGGSWMVDSDSIRVAVAAPQQKDGFGRPQRFDPTDGSGVSDHWPLALEIIRSR